MSVKPNGWWCRIRSYLLASPLNTQTNQLQSQSLNSDVESVSVSSNSQVVNTQPMDILGIPSVPFTSISHLFPAHDHDTKFWLKINKWFCPNVILWNLLWQGWFTKFSHAKMMQVTCIVKLSGPYFYHQILLHVKREHLPLAGLQLGSHLAKSMLVCHVKDHPAKEHLPHLR